MDAHGCRELEVNSRRVNDGVNLKGANVFGYQFLVGGFQGYVPCSQPDLLAVGVLRSRNTMTAHQTAIFFRST